MADEPQISEGAQGEWVTYLQELLIQWGYDTGPVDGDFGPLTDAAVRAFQQDHGLAVDGIVGPITWPTLTGESAPADDDGGGGGTAQSISVDNPVTLVLQATDHTCWAASSAMLLGEDEQHVIDTVGDGGGDGADEPEMERFTAALGLRIVPPMCMTPEGWAQLLQDGPLMVGIPQHYVVVAGIKSDGTDEGTHLHIFDPAVGELWGPWLELNQQYELDADAGANLIQR